MGKKSRASSAKPSAAPVGASAAASSEVPVPDMQEHIAKATELKAEGNGLFAKKEFAKALEAYQQAASSFPHDHPDKPLMLCNRAACYTMLKKPKEAAKECSNALTISPGYSKALLWRSKAYEAQGLYKQALSDVQSLNKTTDASTDSKASEQRLKDIMSGKTKPVQPVQSPRAPQKSAASARQQQLPQFTAKCTLDGDTRVLYLNHNTTYPDLINQVKAKFPTAGAAFTIRYTDKEGDVITVSSRNDIHTAMAESLAAMDKRPGNTTIPPVRFDIVKDQAEEVFELDDWLIDFANLFREHLGIGPDRHVDLQNEGWEKCTAALDAAVQSEKATPLFDAAASRFAEVTASGLYHWGNVHMCIARKYVDQVASTGQTVDDIAPQIRAEFDKAEAKYEDSLRYKADFYDGAVGMGQLAFERAKLHTGLLIPAATAAAGDGDAAKAAQETANAQMREALGKITPDMAKTADELFDKAVEHFKSAITMLPPEEEEKKAEEKVEAADKAAAEGEEISFRAQALVMWGNVLYEQSQVRAAVNGDWKPLVDEAVVKFNEAGCQQADIRAALLNHMKKDDIEIPPEPEVKTEEKAGVKTEVKEEGPKGGLTSLGQQPKKSAKAEEKADGKEVGAAVGKADDTPAEASPKGGLTSLGPQKKNAKKGGGKK